MREPTTWIKLDRNITEWRWVRYPITLAVWIHLLVRANYKDVQIGKDTVHRGEVYLSQEILASEVGITRKQLRTALEHLEETGEIRAKRKIGKTVVISIPNYDTYQSEGPRKGHERATKGPDIKNNKKDKNITPSLSLPQKPYHIPTLEEVREYERKTSLGKDPELFFRHYARQDWKAKDQPIYNWQKLYEVWEAPEKLKLVQDRPQTITDEDGVTYEWSNGEYHKVRKGMKR